MRICTGYFVEVKVLIVDDSSIMRKAIHKYLSKLGVDIIGSASDGKTALEMFKEQLPDAVTLDITMPEMNGLQCLDEMLKIKADAKVLIISALKDESTALEAINKGAKGFLGKPFNAATLEEAFSQL